MTEHEKKVIRLMNNHLSRTKRQLEKAKSFYYSTVPELESRVNEIKERLKLYRHKIKTNPLKTTDKF